MENQDRPVQQEANAAQRLNNLNNSLELISFQNQVSLLKLDKDNYSVWKKQIMRVLKSFELEDFITGSRKCPVKFHTDGKINPDYRFWIRQDQMIGSWLISCMTNEFVKIVSDCEISRDMWICVDKYFLSQHRDRVMQYKSELSAAKKGSMSITEFIHKIQTLASQLLSVGCNISEDDQIIAILNGLDSDYDSVVANVKEGGAFSLQQVKNRLLIHESRIRWEKRVNLTSMQPLIDESSNNVMSLANLAPQRTPSLINSLNNSTSLDNYRGTESFSFSTNPSQLVSNTPYFSNNIQNPPGFRGRNFSGSGAQCQICGKVGHVAGKCWERFNTNFVPVRQQMQPRQTSQSVSVGHQAGATGAQGNPQSHLAAMYNSFPGALTTYQPSMTPTQSPLHIMQQPLMSMQQPLMAMQPPAYFQTQSVQPEPNLQANFPLVFD